MVEDPQLVAVPVGGFGTVEFDPNAAVETTQSPVWIYRPRAFYGPRSPERTRRTFDRPLCGLIRRGSTRERQSRGSRRTRSSLRLETVDAAPAEPPTLTVAVPNMGPGDTIPLGKRTLRVIGKRDEDADRPPVLIVEDAARRAGPP